MMCPVVLLLLLAEDNGEIADGNTRNAHPTLAAVPVASYRFGGGPPTSCPGVTREGGWLLPACTMNLRSAPFFLRMDVYR